MKSAALLLATLFFSGGALAAETSIAFDGQAPYAMPDVVADNIRKECNLPQYQAAAFSRAAQAAGISLDPKTAEEMSKSPRYIELQLLNAVSSGNAFIGHNKQVSLAAKLFKDGKEIGDFKATRSSMGGFGAGFKGSCAVLERCADTLADDLVRWVKQQQLSDGASADKKPDAAPAATTPNT